MNQAAYRWKASIALVGLCVLLAACVTTWRWGGEPDPNRGVRAKHAFHAENGLECLDCHEINAGQRVAFPKHDTCSMCHTIEEDAVPDQSCMTCHTRDDYSIEPLNVLLTEESKFDHSIHVEAELDCAVCHENPGEAIASPGKLMPICMDCHANADTPFTSIASTEIDAAAFRSNECAVCHRELSTETIPTSRHGERIAHDTPQIWERVHGQEAHVDQMFCAQCHDDRDDCTVCHQTQKPKDHTLTFNRNTHGLLASMNRQRCATCHEEESCRTCHEQARPVSHRGAFLGAQSSHCVECHFPPENNCTVCHDEIEHRAAPASPHTAGPVDPNCGACHPGGVPGAVPHFLNQTTSCRTCHQ